MKKLLILIILTTLLSSCIVEPNVIDNPEKITTIEIQNSVVDSCITMSIVDDKVYLLKNGQVQHILLTDSSVDLTFLFMLFIIVIIVFVVLIFT